MENTLFLQVFTKKEEFQKCSKLKLPLESFITYTIYKYCSPEEVDVKFVSCRDGDVCTLDLHCTDVCDIIGESDIPWPVAACVYPVALYKDTVITGLCGVTRHICKHKSLPSSSVEHEEGLLGFRKSCVQAPNEVSVWTKFCEVDVIKTVHSILSHTSSQCIDSKPGLHEVPINLVRFENHLSKPVRLHNIYKIARDIKKDKSMVKVSHDNDNAQAKTVIDNKTRVPKTRKWKSNIKKELEVDCSIQIDDLDVSHHFAEGPFLTLADLILLPSYYILLKSFGLTMFESVLPLTYKWFKNTMQVPEVTQLQNLFDGLEVKPLQLTNLTVPNTDDVSLYKRDPKRHNPKKRLFTKEDDIVKALSTLVDEMQLTVTDNELQEGIDWNNISDGANPLAGHLPDERMFRKSQQLENLALAVIDIAKEGDLIVDFCSGSGHLGILIAHMLPNCTVILLENKEQSLLRARERVHSMALKNVYFFQCNLDFFVGKFDIGVALHACGVASDLVLDKCLKANAKFVLCPCCYGSLHATDRLVYPRSNKFSYVPIDHYLCIGHAADQTHEDHPLTTRGDKCMVVIDSDRASLAEENGYKVTLRKLKPLSCTPKNNLLIGIPS